MTLKINAASRLRSTVLIKASTVKVTSKDWYTELDKLLKLNDKANKAASKAIDKNSSFEEVQKLLNEVDKTHADLQKHAKLTK